MAESNSSVQKPPIWVGLFMRKINAGHFDRVYQLFSKKLEKNKEAKRYYEALKSIFAIKPVILNDTTLTKYWVAWRNPNGGISEGYDGTALNKFTEELVKIYEVYLMATALGIYNYKHGAITKNTFVTATKRTIERYLWLKPVQEDLEYSITQVSGASKEADEKALQIVDTYINELNDPVNEYSDPIKLVDAVEEWRPPVKIEKTVEVMVMAEATATATNQTNASSIFTSLLDAVYSIIGSIVNALKQYATDIAEILVASMLGYAVIRYGRRILTGFTNMISALF